MEKPTSSAHIRQALNRRCARLGIAATGFFELTPRCNLRCRMCYVRLIPEQMAPIGRERTAEEWLDLGRQARDAGMVFLVLSGGEPTLRSDFAQIYEGLVNLGLSITIITNGTRLTPQLRQLWHRLPPAQVNVTLYGVCREDYAALCGDPSAFDAVVDGLEWLRSEGILVHLNTTITPINRHRWLQIEEFAKERGLELRMTAYCFPPSRRAEGGPGWDDFTRLTPEDTARLLVDDLYFREGPEGVRKKLASLDTAPAGTCALEAGEPMRCHAGKSQFWVTWDGRMTPCAMVSQPVSHPFRTGFAESWETLKAQTAQIRLCPDCTACPDRSSCFNCAAVIYAETGRFDAKPQYMCQLTRAYRQIITDMAPAPEHSI